MDLYEESLKRKIEHTKDCVEDNYYNPAHWKGSLRAYEDALETYQRIKNEQ